MAKNKNQNEVDIWANVPSDIEGRYLEAATDESGFVLASETIPSVTTYRINDGQEIGTRETAQVQPNGAIAWLTSGPPGARVTESLERVPNTGGHNHGGADIVPEAVGVISPNSFILPDGYPQNVRSVYRAPYVCGAVRLITRFSKGSPAVIENRIEILIQGLQVIPSSSELKLKPPTTEHPSSYWADPEFIKKLHQLAMLYASKTQKAITITDASLVWGGRFDLKTDWLPPHHEHMYGRQADIRKNDMTPSDKEAFIQAAANVGIANVLEESDHWHVSDYGRSGGVR